MEQKVFKIKCIDGGVADQVTCEAEKMDLLVERHGERLKGRRKKRTRAIDEEVLLVNVIGEEVDLAVVRQELTKLCQDYRFHGVELEL